MTTIFRYTIESTVIVYRFNCIQLQYTDAAPYNAWYTIKDIYCYQAPYRSLIEILQILISIINLQLTQDLTILRVNKPCMNK